MGDRIRRAWVRTVGGGLLALGACAAHAHGGLLGFDRFDEREDTGIFTRANQKRLDLLAIAGVTGLAAWEGSETRLGRTAWEALDAGLMTAATTETLKRAFSRPRPAENPDPGTWFAGARHRSFPSGEVAMMAAFATPFVRNYQADYPAAWALAALPLYMANARMASQGHWLTDVVAGGAIGAGIGYYAAGRDVPLVLSLTPHGAFVGLHSRF